MDKALTRLEACMLGLYLAGITKLEFSPCGRNWFLYMYHDERLMVCGSHPGDYLAEIITEDEIKAREGTIEILPWLQSHNVPIPEVSDAK